MSIITISREYGAGGTSIGQRVARELGIEFYNRDIIRAAARESGLDYDIVEREDEEITRADSFFRAITPAAYIDRRDVIHKLERDMIIMLAKKGDCVILGRCADVILGEVNIESLNVFIYADDIHRAARAGELLGTSDPTVIQKKMKRTDLARRTYYQEYTSRKWGECRNYSLALDSGLLGYDGCVKVIVEAARALDEKNRA